MLNINQVIILLIGLIILYIITLPKKYNIVYTMTNGISKIINGESSNANVDKLENGKEKFYGGYRSNNYSPWLDDDNYWLNTHTNFPFWNSQLGSTRNMSYDLRGDVPIYPGYVGPWNISSTAPIQNKPLWMVS